MKGILNIRASISSIWFGLLVAYIVAGYIAQDVLLPAAVSSYTLYIFLAYSIFAIMCSKKIKLSQIMKWQSICMLLAFLAMLYSPKFSVLSGTYYSMIVNFILVFVLTQMPWNKERFELIMKTYVASAALLIVALGLTGNLNDGSESGRLGTELVGNANILAMMLTVGAMYSVWLIVSSESKLVKVFSFVSLLVIYYGMLLSGGRKYLVAPIIFLYILLLHKIDKKGRKHVIKNTIVVLLAIVFLYQLMMNVPLFYDIVGHRFESFFGLFGTGDKVDGSTRLRKLMTEAGWKQWPNSPIWGHGFDSFKYYNAKEVTGQFYYSHNNFIELLYNQGLIGFIAYYSFYWYLLKQALRGMGDSIYRGFVVGGIVTWLCFEYLAVTYSTTTVQTMLFFCFYCLSYAEE